MKLRKNQPVVKELQGRTLYQEMRKNHLLYLMAFPGLAFFILFHYAPIPGIIVAFKEFNFYDGIFGSPWNGIKNFKFFINSPALPRTLKNTFVLNTLMISLGLLFQIGVALLLNEIRVKYYKKVTQSMMIFPFFISFIVVSVILYQLFNFHNGVANRILAVFGKDPHRWYHDSDAWLIIYLSAQIWKGTGYGTIIYLAAITSIDQEMYDSAIIDGANRAQQAWYVTVPSILPVATILTLLAVGRIFTTDAGSIYALIADNAMLFKHLDTIDLYVFRNLRHNPNLGMSTAVGLMQSVMSFIFVIGANAIMKRIYPQGAIF